MATIDVIMPQMGESIAEGTLSRWIKKVGEAVKRDEPIFEISTDKVDAEIPAPSAGVLTEILVQEGQTVAVQTVVARIDTEAAAGAATPAARSGSGGLRRPRLRLPSLPHRRLSRLRPRPRRRRHRRRPPPPRVRPPRRRARGTSPRGTARWRRRKTGCAAAAPRWCARWPPSTTSIISEIPGTGLAGRVTKNDVLGYIEGGQRVAPPAPTPSRAPAAATEPAGAPRAPAAPQVDPWEGDTVEPWSRIRKLTAEHMVMSRRVSPHVNTIFEIDYTRIAQLRGRKKQEYASRGVNLTFLAFIAKATADALRRHPRVNAAVSGESTIVRRDINLGIAVALDWGLIVPVIKHADELSLLGLARAINDLGERARGKKLSPDEVQKGTFTITNPGVFGSVIGTPIINQPQAAILCVGAIEKQPSVITVDGTDTIGVRTKGMLSLAFDHRIVDGSDADRFMADVKKTLQEFPEGAV